MMNDVAMAAMEMSSARLEMQYSMSLQKKTMTDMEQQAMGELIDDKLVISQSVRNRSHLSITDEGRKMLNFFQNDIHRGIREDIDKYLKENAFELRNENSVLADYRKASSGEYEAHLVAKEKGVTLINLTLSVPAEETAAAICDNWMEKNQEIYQYLIGELF